MNSEINKLLNSNSDLKSYLDKYKDHKEALHFLLNDFYNHQLSSENNELITNFFLRILSLLKDNRIALEDYDDIKHVVVDLDPLYFLNLDFDNIKYISITNDENILFDILDLSINKNYEFTNDDKFFIDNIIFNNIDLLIYFINNCQYNDEVIGIITEYFDDLFNQDLFYIYNRINNEYLKEFLLGTLNFDNVYVDTIIDHQRFYLMVSNEEETINLLKKIKEQGLDLEIILIVDRVNLDFIDKASEAYNDKIRISPLQNQEHKIVFDGIWDFPDYSIEEIKSREETLDLYAKTVLDKKDRDGDIKSLSPLEKFIAAYILTTKFAPYKEEKEDKDNHVSRSVYELVDKTTKRCIVCTGYVHLMIELLYRMGLTDVIRWDIHSKSETKDDDGKINHTRLVIHLVDPKYGIDAVFMSDPTWDEGFLRNIIDHMLMSKDELRQVDPELSDKDLRMEELLVKINTELNVSNANEAFNKQIPDDTIVKAFLAVYRFLDKNMKMLSDDEDYPLLEYADMAVSLGMGFNKSERNKIVSDLMDLTPKEILEYRNLIQIFRSGFIYYLERAISRSHEEVHLNVYCNENNNSIKVCFCVDPLMVDMEQLSEEYEVLNSGSYKADVVLMELSDKPIMKQYMELINKIKSFNEKVYNKSLGNNNQGLK